MSVRDRWCHFALVMFACVPCVVAETLEVDVQPATPEPAVVALVNGEVIYFEDVENKLVAAHTGRTETQRGAPDLERLLDNLVHDTLLAQEARAAEMHLEEPTIGQVARYRENVALKRLEREELHAAIEVGEEDLRTVFERDYATADVHILTVDEREQAESLLAELREGGDFEALAREHSVDQYGARGGLIEDIERIDMPPTLGQAVWATEPGGLAGPVQTGLGWTIARVDAFPEQTEERFEKLRRELADQVRFQKFESRRHRFARRLREAIPVEIDRELVDAVGVERLSDGRLEPVIEDLTAVVASVGDRRIDAETFRNALRKRWRSVRNQEAALAAKLIVLDRLIEAELTQAEALRRGYDESPDTERAVHAFETQQLVQRYLTEIVAPRIEISDEDVAGLYEKMKEEFRKSPRVHVGQITVADEQEAQRLAGLLREGADLAWLARRHSNDRFKDAGGVRGWMTPSFGLDPIQDEIYNAQPGDVIGPAGTPGTWLVYQVTAREEQGYLELEQVRPKVRSILFAGRFREYLGDYLTKLRERSEIEIDQDVLESMQIGGEQLESDAPSIPRSHGG